MTLTWRAGELRRLWPHAPTSLVDGMEATKAVLAKYAITTKPRLVQFLATISEETGAGMRLEEDLRYSGPRLWALFGHHHFHDLADAISVAHQGPRAIADRIYGGRMSNRPGTHDGYDFRGRGLMQLTGRANYEAVSKVAGIDFLAHPEWLSAPEHCLEAAAAWWQHAGVNAIADTGNTTAVTRRVNGGLIGLEARLTWVATWSHAAFDEVDAVATELLNTTGKLLNTPATPAPPDHAHDSRWVQDALNAAGADPKLVVDGRVRKKTEAAIRIFKVTHGLPDTPVVDKETLEALEAVMAPRHPPRIRPE